MSSIVFEDVVLGLLREPDDERARRVDVVVVHQARRLDDELGPLGRLERRDLPRASPR